MWSQPVAAYADDARCLTLVSTNAQVSFEFETVQTLTVYIAGISHILNSGGMVVQLEEGQQPAAGASSSSAPAPKGNGRRYSVMPFVAPAELPTNPQDVVNQLAARRPTLMALSAASTILLMEEGRVFTRYFTKPDGSVAKEQVQLFVEQAAARGSVDAIYWCAPGSHLAQPNQRVVLSQVTDIFMYVSFRAYAWGRCSASPLSSAHAYPRFSFCFVVAQGQAIQGAQVADRCRCTSLQLSDDRVCRGFPQRVRAQSGAAERMAVRPESLARTAGQRHCAG